MPTASETTSIAFRDIQSIDEMRTLEGLQSPYANHLRTIEPTLDEVAALLSEEKMPTR